MLTAASRFLARLATLARPMTKLAIQAWTAESILRRSSPLLRLTGMQ